MSFAHISFSTDAFADSAETLSGNFNGIAGKALAEWIVGALRNAGLDVTDVYAEGHGWDFDVSHAGVRYHCSASIEADDDGRAGGVTIGKTRSLGDKLMRRNKLTADDPVVGSIGRALEGSALVRTVTLEMA